MLRKEDNDWVKKCMEYEVEGTRPRDTPKRTCREVVQKDCQVLNSCGCAANADLNKKVLWIVVDGGSR